MGCVGSLPGVPQAPEIDISAEDIAGAIKDALEGIPKQVADNIATFKAELNKCEKEYEVPDTNMTLQKEATDNEIRLAAIVSAFATAGRDAVKDATFGAIEPTIDEQLNAVEGLPQKIKDTAKDKFKEATVDPAVDKACDEALAKMKADAEAGGDAAAPGA